ncbi:MAG: substrate-binding domain-containing protein [Microcoleaceae cyanobacterium]
MTQKNEAKTLILTFLITLGLLGLGYWLFRMITSGSSPQNIILSDNNERFADIKNVPAGTFNYGGSTTLAPIRKEIDSVIQAVEPNFSLRYLQHPTLPPGSGTGITMLLDNQLAFAQTSRSIQDQEYQQAAQKGLTLKEIAVAIDGIALVVNPQLDIPGLTINQIQDIYTGNIRNWSQFGGDNITIQPSYRSIEAGGIIQFFVKNILGGATFGDNVELIKNTTEALRKFADNPGGIYYASVPEIVGQCTVKPIAIGSEATNLIPSSQTPFVPLDNCPAQSNQLNNSAFQTGEYPMTRRLFVAIKEDNQVARQAGVTYANFMLTEQGQDLLQETGFVRVR